MKILMIDNYDSFTYNLVQLVRENSSHQIDVFRNNDINIGDVAQYDKIMLSPGPGLPAEAGIMCDVIRFYKTNKSIFGVCLGLQAIAAVFGGDLYNLTSPLHGVSTLISHTSSTLFEGIPDSFMAGRYHSWAVADHSLPPELCVTATDEAGTIMALEHRQYDIRGVQFHPESILTEYGREIILNFLKY